MEALLKNIVSSILILLSILGSAQKADVVITSDKFLPVSNGQLVTLILKIENKTNQKGEFQLQANADPTINLLKKESKIALEENGKMFLSFKFLVTKNQPAGRTNLEFKILDADKNILSTATTRLEIAPKRVLRISTNNPQEIIYQVGDSLRIKTEVYNGGNQTETVKLMATFPTLQGSVITQEKNIKMLPFTRKTITFSKIIDNNLLRQELFNVSIAMLSESNEFLGNAMVLVQNALGNRRYMDPDQQRLLQQVGRGNQISWSMRNPFNKLDAAQTLNINAVVNSGDLSSELSVNGTYYHSSTQPILFQSTFLKMERDGLGLKLGNLTSSDLDLSLVGRGVEFFLLPWQDRKTTFRIGAVEKSYNLFDPLDLRNSPRGYSAFATASTPLGDRKILKTDLVFDEDTFAENILLNTSYLFSNDITQYKFSLGYGNSKAKEGTDLHEDSFAVGFNYQTRWKNYSFYSENYFSTGYYPGIRKGSTILSQRINRRLGKANLWGNYSFNLYEPKNISPLYWYSSSTQRQNLELGAQFQIGKQISLSLSPQFQSEKSNIFLIDLQKSSAVEFQTTTINQSLTVQSKNYGHRFNLTMQQGIARYVDITHPSFILKSQFNYSYKNLMVNLTAQKGNFMLFEGSRPEGLSNETRKYSAMATYQKDFFQNKLKINFGAMAIKDTYQGTSLSINSNLELKLGQSTKLFAYYNYTKYLQSIYDFSNNYFQFGITQDIPQLGEQGVSYKNGTIEVLVYHDTNNNGSYEEGIDYPAVGKQVQINKTIFITSKEGRVKYRKVPYGNYTIKSLETDWFSDSQKTHLDGKLVSLELPLEKTGRITGFLQYAPYNKNQYEVSPNLTGTQILFKNEQGREFIIYTNDQGRYDAFLPLGTYFVAVNPESLQQNTYVDVNPIQVSAKETEQTNVPLITIKVRERRVEIKRFGQ